MSWEECKAHNQQHYNEVFMFPDFAPKTWAGWHALLLKMSRSPYLRALHLAEADKVWHHDTSSWESFVLYIGKEGGQEIGRWKGGVGMEAWLICLMSSRRLNIFREELVSRIYSASTGKLVMWEDQVKSVSANPLRPFPVA